MSKKFYNKCSENSRSQIVCRTDVFRKLTLGAPDRSKGWSFQVAEIRIHGQYWFLSLVYGGWIRKGIRWRESCALGYPSGRECSLRIHPFLSLNLSLFLSTGGLPHLPGAPHLHASTSTKSKTIYVSYSPWSPGRFPLELRAPFNIWMRRVSKQLAFNELSG